MRPGRRRIQFHYAGKFGVRFCKSFRYRQIKGEKCPRLRAYCAAVAREKRRAFRAEEYWGKPLPGFGDPQARLLIVGLAPAAHGGNPVAEVLGVHHGLSLDRLRRPGPAVLAVPEQPRQ